jgi:cytoskeletal protein RodZ
LAAPLAANITRVAPARLLLGAAAVLVIGISIWQGVQVWPQVLEQLAESGVTFTR